MFVNVDYADQIPIVDDEMKKAAGDEKEEDIQMIQGVVQKLVTADGTYASQSAFSALLPVKKDQVRFVPFLFIIYSHSFVQETIQHFTIKCIFWRTGYAVVDTFFYYIHIVCSSAMSSFY